MACGWMQDSDHLGIGCRPRGALVDVGASGFFDRLPGLELEPAKVFMGDVGSTFLGAVFAGLVLQAPAGQRR